MDDSRWTGIKEQLELQERIEARKADAKSKGLWYKIEEITKKKGRNLTNRRGDGNGSEYEEDGLFLEYHYTLDGWSDVDYESYHAYVNGKEVFRYYHSAETYIPGPWVDRVLELYLEMHPQKPRPEKRVEFPNWTERQMEDLKKRYGL